jgi:hypothetical protein
MKKSILALSLAGAFLFTSCESEVVVDDATVESIVNQAVAAVLAQIPSSTAISAEVTSAVQTAVSAAVAQGFAGQENLSAAELNELIQAGLAASQALTNPPIVRVGNGGIKLITEDATWSNDTIWIMDGKVVVTEGAELTIEEGTIVKSTDNGTGADATTLVIAPDGKINAAGSAAKPIIFTAISDDMVYANGSTSPNMALTQRNLWGCVVVLGDDVIGRTGGTAEIEGIQTGYDWTVYGGSNTAHDAGIMDYISIRHTGSSISPGNELQGLTLGGVGAATQVSNIEIIASGDDGIEIFGGSVDVTNLLVMNQLDDAIDLDEAYKGTISNAVVLMAEDSDTVFEIDGTETDDQSITGEFTVSGISAYGLPGIVKPDTYGNWKDTATGFVDNVLYQDFPAGTTFGYITEASENVNGVSYSGAGTAPVAGDLLFRDIVVVDATQTKAGLAKDDTDLGSATWLTVRSTVPATGGADLTVFEWCQAF